MKVEVYIDLYDVFDELTSEEKQEFINNNIEEASDEAIISHVADNISLDDLLEAFNEDEIKCWLEDNAEDYGYVKEGENND